MKTYNLFLDDFRTPEMAFSDCLRDVRFLKEEWVIAQSHNDFVNIVQEKFLDNSFPKLVAFDHDLADVHYEHINNSSEWWAEYYANSNSEKTGYHSAKWFIEFVIDNKLRMPDVLIHTRNQSGGLNIKSLFSSYYKLKQKGLLDD